MISRLRDHLNETEHASLIIEDVSSFPGEEESRGRILMEWCREAEDRIRVIALMRQNRDLASRYRLLFEEKIVLSCRHEQEISDFFSRSVRSSFQEKQHFLISRDRFFLHGVYPPAGISDIHQLKKKNTYILPVIPRHYIVPHGSPVLGLFLDDLTPFIPEDERQIIVTGIYEENLKPLYRLLKQRDAECLFLWHDKQTEARYLFMIMDIYERSMYRQDEDAYLLFVGPGFRKQYTLKAYLPRDLKANEGILYDHKRPRRIRLAEERR
jgi:hypothetical protein